MIRAIQQNEVKLLTPMALKFWEEGNVPGKIVTSIFESNWSKLIQSGTGRVFAKFNQGIAIGAIGIILTSDINTGEKVCEEAFWFVDPSHRKWGIKILLKAIEYAEASECQHMCMVHLEYLSPEKLGSFYERMGFRLIERKYLKTF